MNVNQLKWSNFVRESTKPIQFDKRMGLMQEFYKLGYRSDRSQEKTFTDLVTDQDK